MAQPAGEGQVQETARRERLETRLTSDQKRVVRHAAAIEGRSVSDFVVASAVQRAEEVIRAHQIIHLSVRDSMVFADTVLSPEAPNNALLAAAHRHNELIDP